MTVRELRSKLFEIEEQDRKITIEELARLISEKPTWLEREIRVYNDEESVFEGTILDFLVANESDGDVEDLLKLAHANGEAVASFFSGDWHVVCI